MNTKQTALLRHQNSVKEKEKFGEVSDLLDASGREVDFHGEDPDILGHLDFVELRKRRK